MLPTHALFMLKYAIVQVNKKEISTLLLMRKTKTVKNTTKTAWIEFSINQTFFEIERELSLQLW